MNIKRLNTALRGANLSGKMMRAVICLTAAILLLTFLIVYHVAKREMQRIISVQQFGMITSLAREIDDKISFNRDHLVVLASQMTPEILASHERSSNFLDHQRDDMIIFDKGLYLLSPELTLLAGNHEALFACNNGAGSIAAQLQDVIKTAKPLVSEPLLLCGDAANPVILFATPIVDRTSHVTGLLAGVASVMNEDFLAGLRHIKLGEGGYVYLYNQKRLMILHPDRDRILKRDVPLGVNQMFDRALDGFEGSGETTNSRGLQALSSFKRLKTTGWILAANFPVDEAYAPVEQALEVFLPIFVGMLLFAGFVTLTMMRRLTSPLTLLSERFSAYRDDASMEPIHLETGDEIELLADTYNEMLNRISEQQNQLKEDIRFLEILLEVMPNPVYYKDIRGRYLGCNRAFEVQLGIAKKDLIGKTVFNITPGHLAPGYHQSDLELLAQGPGQTLTYESPVLWGDGELHDAIFYKATYSDSNGNLLGLIGTILDITQLRHSYRKIQDQRLLLRNIIDYIPHAIFWKDRQLVYQGCNKRFAALAGVGHPKDIRGKTDYDLALEPEDARFFRDNDRKVMASGTAQLNTENILQQPDDTQAILLTSKVPLHDPAGEVNGILGIFLDITDRKRIEEELLNKNAELERFIYTVSHDLKSPVVTIKAFLGLLEANLAQGDTEVIKQDIQYIHNAADKLSRQIDELLEMSRIGRVNFIPEYVSFREVVDEAMSYVAGAFTEKAVKVTMDEGFAGFFADRARLVEIWQNLLENAVKYMGDQPSPRIEVGFENTSSGPRFFVRDNGMGIAPRYQDKIFDLFEKLDPKSEGTGLGLAMVKRIVEHYGGTIHVASQGKERGACFRFTLPLAMNEGDQPDAPGVVENA